MSLIEWKDEFEIGIAAVDTEHRELIAAINELDGQLREGPELGTVSAALGEIHALISAHFALEERYMRDTAYADFVPHKQDHESLLDQLRDIMDRVEDEGGFDETRLSAELDDWFTVHFRTHDAKLHRHERSREAGR
jgi:hemerythrin